MSKSSKIVSTPTIPANAPTQAQVASEPVAPPVVIAPPVTVVSTPVVEDDNANISSADFGRVYRNVHAAQGGYRDLAQALLALPGQTHTRKSGELWVKMTNFNDAVDSKVARLSTADLTDLGMTREELLARKLPPLKGAAGGNKVDKLKAMLGID